MTRGASKRWLIAGSIVLGVFVLAGFVWLQSIRTQVLEIYVFDLPGTPAVFVRTPSDKRILINGGSNSEIIRRLSEILPFYSKHIDALIASEANGKTVSGLIDVLNRYSIDEIYLASATSSDPIYDVFLKTAHDLKIKTGELRSGNEILWEEGAPSAGESVKASILFPALPEDFQYSKASPPQIILRIQYGKTSFLLTGHSTPKIQKFIAKNVSQTDVLMTFNSLTDSNIAKELITAANPKYMIYSALSKPKKEKPDSLAGVLLQNRFNIRETGGVKIVSNGKTVSVGRI